MANPLAVTWRLPQSLHKVNSPLVCSCLSDLMSFPSQTLLDSTVNDGVSSHSRPKERNKKQSVRPHSRAHSSQTSHTTLSQPAAPRTVAPPRQVTGVVPREPPSSLSRGFSFSFASPSSSPTFCTCLMTHPKAAWTTRAHAFSGFHPPPNPPTAGIQGATQASGNTPGLR